MPWEADGDSGPSSTAGHQGPVKCWGGWLGAGSLAASSSGSPARSLDPAWDAKRWREVLVTGVLSGEDGSCRTLCQVF